MLEAAPLFSAYRTSRSPVRLTSTSSTEGTMQVWRRNSTNGDEVSSPRAQRSTTMPSEETGLVHPCDSAVSIRKQRSDYSSSCNPRITGIPFSVPAVNGTQPVPLVHIRMSRQRRIGLIHGLSSLTSDSTFHQRGADNFQEQSSAHILCFGVSPFLTHRLTHRLADY